MELDATHATLLLLLLLSFHASGQPTTPAATATTTDPQQEDVAVSFRPSIAIVIGIFSIMFSLTFLLIMYAKFCHTAAAGLYGHDPETLLPNSLLATATSRFSGMDKSVIESLPFFRFSSLKGSKEGLECAVCLSRFEDAEVLRLLPKCKHAFHIDCVDRWLEGHSSCPLCRHRVEVEDVTLFKYSSSSRFLFRNQSTAAGGDLDLELYVEREVDGGERGNGSSLSSSSRFTLGGSFRMKGRTSTKEQSLLPERGGGRGDDGEEKFLHKFKHRIIVSDVVFKNRWSDLNSADLTSLNSEMLNLVSSQRFSDRFGPAMVARAEAAAAVDMESGGSTSTISRIKEEMERKRLLDSKAGQMKAAISGNSESSTTPTSRPPDPSPPPNPLITSGKRSVSEITNVSRFVDGRVRGARDHSAIVIGGREEKVRRVWLPIARKTVQWFEGRDRRPPQPQLRVPDV